MSDFKEIAKHSINYLFAQIATKALAFISIPVYTRLLTVEEFGIVNVFLSTIGISSCILTLNTEVAISRYYYDKKDEDDFKEFIGANITIVCIIFIIMSLAVIISLPWISKILSFDYLLTLSLIPVSLYNITNSIFQQIYSVLLQSKKIALVSSIQIYLAFILSVIIILLMDDNKYYGQVLGTIIAMIILWQYIIRQILPYCKFGKIKKHIKYILSYSIPYLPYTLSGIIIAQLGRLITSQYSGFEAAGKYSFAANIGMIMIIVISVSHSAWNPYYFQYMNDKKYKNIDTVYTIIWGVTLLIGLILILFGNEIGHLLGKQEYYSSLYLIPFFTIGYMFYQWAYVYMRNTGYAKKVIWNAIAVVISGVSNIFLSITLVKYGDLGVALSFCLSYMILLIISWAINKFIIKLYAPRCNLFIVPFIYTILIAVIYYGFSQTMQINIVIRIVIILASTFIIFKDYNPYLFKKILNKK